MRRPLGLLFALLLVAGCASGGPEAAPPSQSLVAVALTMDPCPSPSAPAGAGDVLPELSFPCLVGYQDLTLGVAPGVPTVLNLWAPWCAPCRAELPLFDRLHVEARDDVSVVGLVEKDTLQSSLTFAAETRLSFPSALDQTGRLLYDQGLNGLPATFFLRADGSIAHRQIGPIASYDELRALVAEHLEVAVP